MYEFGSNTRIVHQIKRGGAIPTPSRPPSHHAIPGGVHAALCIPTMFRNVASSHRSVVTIVPPVAIRPSFECGRCFFFQKRPHQFGTLQRPGMQSATPQNSHTSQQAHRLAAHLSQRGRRRASWQVSTTGLSGGVTNACTRKDRIIGRQNQEPR